MIDGDKELFFKSLNQLTKGQLEFLRPMITENTLDLFTAEYDFHFSVKISGSGGGGYVLGFTDDVVKTNKLLGFEGIDSNRTGLARNDMPSKFDVIWL